MSFGPYDLVMDFALMSLLLLLAQYLRGKIKLIQKLYLPSSLIAGFLGLFLGHQFLDLMPFSGQLADYPYMLVVVLFATLFIGREKIKSFGSMVDKVGDTFTLNLAAEVGGFGTALLLGGFLIRRFFPATPDAFPLLQPAGFVGGHGYAAAIGGSLETLLDWEGAIPIGQTFATVGLVSAVLFGLLIINIATRMNATRFVSTMEELPDSMRTGLVPENKRNSMGDETVNPMSIDPLTWHVLLVLIATAGGYYGFYAFAALPFDVELPMMALSMLAGVILHFGLKGVGLGDYVDRRIIKRIGSSSTDYLVAFGVASIDVSIVMQYIAPLIILVAIGILYNILFLSFAGRKLFQNFWFERSIFCFGWTTGVVAMGVTLLRVVDPEFSSGTLEDYGMAYVFISIIELGIVAFTPIFAAQGHVLSTGAVLMLGWAFLLFITAKKYGVRGEKVDEMRPGESEIISSQQAS